MDCQPKLQLYSMLFFEIFLKSLWLYARENKEHTIICKLKYIQGLLTNKAATPEPFDSNWGFFPHIIFQNIDFKNDR